LTKVSKLVHALAVRFNKLITSVGYLNVNMIMVIRYRYIVRAHISPTNTNAEQKIAS